MSALLNQTTKKSLIPGLMCLISLAVTSAPVLSSESAYDTKKTSPVAGIALSEIKHHLNVLAHDSLMGRGTGQKGAEIASDYINAFYNSDTFSGLDGFEIHRQKFSLEGVFWENVHYSVYTVEDTDTQYVAQSSLQNNAQNNKTSSMFYPIHGGAEKADSPVVFAGFGPGDHSYRMPEVSRSDFKNKWVLMFEPDNSGPNSHDTSFNISRSDLVSVMKNNHGATGILFISRKSTDEWEDERNVMKQQLDRPLAVRKPGQRFRHAERSSNLAVSVHPDIAIEMLGLETTCQLDSLRSYWETSGKAGEVMHTGHYFKNDPLVGRKDFEEENIIVVLPGHNSDTKEEAVIVSAHYDHLGLGEPDDGNDIVYNGADDNASGTAVILEMARAFAASTQSGYRNDRTLVFLHTAAEEWGLYGARYYAENPLFPLEKTISNINVDMIGYIDDRYVEEEGETYIYYIGAGMVSSGLQRMLEQANSSWSVTETELILDDHYNDASHPMMLYRRSDQWAFGERNIPFVYFFSGLHDYYHTPSDTADKIAWSQLGERTRFITELTRIIAKDGERPRIDVERPGPPSMRSR